MPVTALYPCRRDLRGLIRYVENPEKTEDGLLVTAIGCSAGNAAADMLRTRKAFHKRKGILAYHLIQSFEEGSVTEIAAHQLGVVFAQEYLGAYESVVATHVDHRCCHNHIVFNAVSDLDGKVFHDSFSLEGIRKIRAASDRIAAEAGIRERENRVSRQQGRKSFAEGKLHAQGQLTSWELFRRDAEEVQAMSEGPEDFYRMMQARGYVGAEDGRGFLSFRPEGQDRAFILQRDGIPMTKAMLEERIEWLKDQPDRAETERFGLPVRYQDLTSIQTLYRAWISVLEQIGAGKKPDGPMQVAYPKLKKLPALRKQAEYLEKNGIHTASDMSRRITRVSETMQQAVDERAELWKERESRSAMDRALQTMDRLRSAEEQYRDGAAWCREEHRRYQKAEQKLEGLDPDTVREERDRLRSQIALANRRVRTMQNELLLCRRIRDEGKELLREYRETDQRMSRFREQERLRRRSRELDR